jgi:thiamine pyrophosphokinase
VIAGRDVIFAAPRSLALRLPVGERISLFPMAAITGRSAGLRWPINGLTLAPDSRIGTSNEVQEAQVTLDFDSDGMLVILPRGNLRAVIAALT